jgi:hypothetical protein
VKNKDRLHRRDRPCTDLPRVTGSATPNAITIGRISDHSQLTTELIGLVTPGPCSLSFDPIGDNIHDLPTMSEQPSQTPQPPNGSQEHPNPPSATPVEPTTDSAVKPEPDLDASIEQDIDMNAEQTQATGDDNAPLPTDVDPMAAAPTPSKKETSLREFLGKMDDYAPIVRDIPLSSHPSPLFRARLCYAMLRPPAQATTYSPRDLTSPHPHASPHMKRPPRKDIPKDH